MLLFFTLTKKLLGVSQQGVDPEICLASPKGVASQFTKSPKATVGNVLSNTSLQELFCSRSVGQLIRWSLGRLVAWRLGRVIPKSHLKTKALTATAPNFNIGTPFHFWRLGSRPKVGTSLDPPCPPSAKNDGFWVPQERFRRQTPHTLSFRLVQKAIVCCSFFLGGEGHNQ